MSGDRLHPQHVAVVALKVEAVDLAHALRFQRIDFEPALAPAAVAEGIGGYRAIAKRRHRPTARLNGKLTYEVFLGPNDRTRLLRQRPELHVWPEDNLPLRRVRKSHRIDRKLL